MQGDGEEGQTGHARVGAWPFLTLLQKSVRNLARHDGSHL